MNKYILTVNDNDSRYSTHPQYELEQLILDYLDPFIDYKKMILVNKYYYKLLGTNPIYFELKSFFSHIHFSKFHPKFEKISHYFINSSNYGCLEIMKYLWRKYDTRAYDHMALKYASTTEIIDFLLEINDKISGYSFQLAFAHNCNDSRLHIAKYLYKISLERNTPIDIRYVNDCIFKNCCDDGHTETAKWLCTLCNKYKIETQMKEVIVSHSIDE